MKKNIEVVTLDRELAELLLKGTENRKELPAREFSAAMRSLLDGGCGSVLLTTGEEAPSLSGNDCIRCSDVTIYPGARRVTRGKEEIPLTPKEFDILCLLARNRGQVFTKEQIYRAVWDDSFVMDNSNIMSFIRKLRKKLEPDADQPRYILTVWGLGYKFSDQD